MGDQAGAGQQHPVNHTSERKASYGSGSRVRIKPKACLEARQGIRVGCFQSCDHPEAEVHIRKLMSEHSLSGIHDLTMDAYQRSEGVSKSMLDKLAHPFTPAHLRAYLDEPRPEPTEAMKYGSILHAALLEPDTIAGAFSIKPEGLDGRTKDGKAWIAEQGGKPIITQEQATAIDRSVANLWKHPQAKRYLGAADFERSLFAKDEHGTLRKGRLDILPKAGNVILDLKTCESAARQDFEKAIENYRYFVQASYYVDLCQLLGIDRSRFVFICVEKKPPYLVAMHSMDLYDMEAGRELYKRDLAVYRQCKASGDWYGYPETIETIGRPAWAQKQTEQAA